MSESIYLCPRAIAGAHAAPGGAPPLAGGPLHFSQCEAAWRQDGGGVLRRVLPLEAARDEPGAAAWLERLSAPRAAILDLEFDRPRLMGVINVTPDSFSDGGDRFDAGRAVDDGLALWEAGADILDIGGESTRPGAEPVPEDEELSRAIPVVRALADAGVRVSIDTRHARVMREAVAAGAAMINDVTALTGDPEALAAAAERGCPVVLMHMQGEPQTMQRSPRYDDAALDVYDFLASRVLDCEQAGIPRGRIVVDPGIGFGKTVEHNLQVLDRLALYQGIGCPVLLGVSRKSLIGKLSRGEPPKERLPGSLAAELAGLARGVQMLRVHDVAETAQALAVWQAIAGGGA